jgi:hypothetical protein
MPTQMQCMTLLAHRCNRQQHRTMPLPHTFPPAALLDPTECDVTQPQVVSTGHTAHPPVHKSPQAQVQLQTDDRNHKRRSPVGVVALAGKPPTMKLYATELCHHARAQRHHHRRAAQRVRPQVVPLPGRTQEHHSSLAEELLGTNIKLQQLQVLAQMQALAAVVTATSMHHQLTTCMHSPLTTNRKVLSPRVLSWASWPLRATQRPFQGQRVGGGPEYPHPTVCTSSMHGLRAILEQQPTSACKYATVYRHAR